MAESQEAGLNIGDAIKVIDSTSVMKGNTGVILEIDFEDSPEAPYICNVLRPGRYQPARCLFARDEIEKV